MYSAFRQLCEQVLRIPPQPETPPGDEAQTRIFLAAPNYYKYLLVQWALKTAVSFLAVLFVFIIPLVGIAGNLSQGGGDAWMVLVLGLECFGLVLALLGSLLALAMVRMDFEKRWYVVTDRSLRVREGVLQVKEATVTFANIQHISISQGPIQRVLGIADLRVDTAGGGGSAAAHGKHGMPNLHTVWFRGVNNANEIKELMQQRLRQLKDSGLGDHEELAATARLESSASLLSALREVRAEAETLRTTVAGFHSG